MEECEVQFLQRAPIFPQITRMFYDTIMNKLTAIVPLNDEELFALANRARLDNVSGWKRLKLMLQNKMRSLDLSEAEVVDAISEHLVRRPIAEAEKIENSVKSDIEATKKMMCELQRIHLTIDQSPDDEMVKIVVNSICVNACTLIRAAKTAKQNEIDMRELAERSPRTGSPNSNYENRIRQDSYRTPSYRYKDTFAHEESVKLQEIIDNYQRHGNYSMIKYSIEDITKKSVFNSLKDTIDWSADDETIRTKLTESVISYITKINLKLTGVDAATRHPVVAELYAKHLEEIVKTKNGLKALLAHLKEQEGKAKAIIEPIQKMADDLRMYLKVAEDISVVRKATAFLGVAEQRNAERAHAISMLAHYSEVACEALTDVKTTLDSYQNAQRELSSLSSFDIEVFLQAREEVYVTK